MSCLLCVLNPFTGSPFKSFDNSWLIYSPKEVQTIANTKSGLLNGLHIRGPNGGPFVNTLRNDFYESISPFVSASRYCVKYVQRFTLYVPNFKAFVQLVNPRCTTLMMALECVKETPAIVFMVSSCRDFCSPLLQFPLRVTDYIFNSVIVHLFTSFSVPMYKLLDIIVESGAVDLMSSVHPSFTYVSGVWRLRAVLLCVFCVEPLTSPDPFSLFINVYISQGGSFYEVLNFCTQQISYQFWLDSGAPEVFCNRLERLTVLPRADEALP